MQEWTAKDIILTVLGSGTFIGSVIVVFNFITARIDARRQRIEATSQRKLADAIEVKKLEVEAEGREVDSVRAAMWKLLEERQGEITALKIEIEGLKRQAILDRPLITQIYAKLRAMRKEIESLNLMVLSEEETNVFMRRFNKVKEILDETEGMLP